jgi:ribosomal protein S18 acetylase RimI-like enzyme
MSLLTPKRNVTYFKRFRMEIDLRPAPPQASLPDGYYWVPWNDNLLESHADALFASFQGELDAVVFPSLGDRRGCGRLMNEIRHKPGFLPAATWLLACPAGVCGSIQGIRERRGLGSIQNVGVVAAHRGRGLGTALLLRALEGFRQAGLGYVFLEATAKNDAAVQLYHRLGFRRRKTIYKVVEIDSLPQASPAIDGRLAFH